MQKQWHVDKTIRESALGWEQWHGSHYELSMAYPLLSQQERLHLLRCTWSDVNLLGIVETPDQFGQPWHDPAPRDATDAHHSYGYIHLTDDHIVGCGSYFTSWGDATWHSLYIPLGQLDRIFPVHYPLAPDDDQWISIVDASFATLGAHIYREMGFKLAVLGEEVSGFPIQSVLVHLADAPNLLVPEALFKPSNIVPHGKHIGEGLWWTGGSESI